MYVLYLIYHTEREKLISSVILLLENFIATFWLTQNRMIRYLEQ